jgi:hypothetical protein
MEPAAQMATHRPAPPEHLLSRHPKPYKLSSSEIPARRTNSLYADIVADFIAQGTESVQVTIQGMEPATLRAGLRRALKTVDGVKMAQR